MKDAKHADARNRFSDGNTVCNTCSFLFQIDFEHPYLTGIEDVTFSMLFGVTNVLLYHMLMVQIPTHTSC